MSADQAQTVVRKTGSPRIPGLTARHIGRLMVQMSDLMDAGCPVSRALEAIARQASQPPLAKLAEALNAEIVNGASLAEAMQRTGRYFSEVQISMVRAAGEGGFLQRTLASLAGHAARQADAVKQVKAKLTYPAVLAITALASVIFLLAYVVPQFTQVYRAADRLLPTPTRALLGVSRVLAGYWTSWPCACPGWGRCCAIGRCTAWPRRSRCWWPEGSPCFAVCAWPGRWSGTRRCEPRSGSWPRPSNAASR